MTEKREDTQEGANKLTGKERKIRRRKRGNREEERMKIFAASELRMWAAEMLHLMLSVLTL